METTTTTTTTTTIIIINVKTRVIIVIIGATGTISKSFRKYVSNIPGNQITPKKWNLNQHQCTHMYTCNTQQGLVNTDINWLLSLNFFLANLTAAILL
jgi:hypothetical protein